MISLPMSQAVSGFGLSELPVQDFTISRPRKRK